MMMAHHPAILNVPNPIKKSPVVVAGHDATVCVEEILKGNENLQNADNQQIQQVAQAVPIMLEAQ